MLHRIQSPKAQIWVNGMVNGISSDPFMLNNGTRQGNNGTRQGCPLWPLLFSIFIDTILATIRSDHNIHISVGRTVHQFAA